MADLQATLLWAQAHPLQALAALVALVALVLAQVRLTREQALRWPRLASLIVVAQRIAPVLRGLLKPVAGVGSAKIALAVIDAIWPPPERGPTSNPPPSGGAP